MPQWRCLNDTFGYCSDKPEVDTSLNVVSPAGIEPNSYFFSGGTCKLDHKTCGKYQTLTEHYVGLAKPLSNSYRHTSTPATKKKGKKGGK